jgi:hypothetical protein
MIAAPGHRPGYREAQCEEGDEYEAQRAERGAAVK